MVIVTGTGRSGTTLMLETLELLGVERKRLFGAELKGSASKKDKFIVCYRNKPDCVKSFVKEMKKLPNINVDDYEKFSSDIYDFHTLLMKDFLECDNIDFVTVDFDVFKLKPKETVEFISNWLKCKGNKEMATKNVRS
jgi:hypothetical protein